MNDLKLKDNLIKFENWCASQYEKGKIRSPMHLSGGNEKELIEVFKKIKKDDWVFTTYRSHYHALLKGVPIKWLMKWILENKSIHVMNKEHKIVSSAIVGGTLSQAVGCAMAIKRKNGKEHVYAFCGDMTASLGTFYECVTYSANNKLPITFVVENNGLSTDTPTKEAWGALPICPNAGNIIIINYIRTWPHYGIGKKVEFT